MSEETEAPKTVEERLAHLEQNERIFLKLQVEQHALTMAMASMIAEMLERAGISRSEAAKHIRERQLHFQDSFYRKLEDTKPHLAADLDTRPLFEFELPPEVRPLFPKGT